MQFSAYRQVDLILDFGEVSTDRQVLSRVTRQVLSNSKHNLLSSDTSIFQIISESETTLLFRSAETWLRLVNNFEFEDIYQLPNDRILFDEGLKSCFCRLDFEQIISNVQAFSFILFAGLML